MIIPITLQSSTLPLSLSRSPRRIFPPKSVSQNHTPVKSKNYYSGSAIIIQSPTPQHIKIVQNAPIPGMKMVNSQIMVQSLQQNQIPILDPSPLYIKNGSQLSVNGNNKTPILDPTTIHVTGSSQLSAHGNNKIPVLDTKPIYNTDSSQLSAHGNNKIPVVDPTLIYVTASSQIQSIPYDQKSKLILPQQVQSLQQSQSRAPRSNYELSLPRTQFDDLIDQFDWDKYGVNPYIPRVFQPIEYENEPKSVQQMPNNQYLALPKIGETVQTSAWPSDRYLQNNMDSLRPSIYNMESQQPLIYNMDSLRPSLHKMESQQPSIYNMDSLRPSIHNMESQQPSLNNSGIVADNFAHQTEYYNPVTENTNISQIYLKESENINPVCQYNYPDESYKQDFLPTPSQKQSIEINKEQEICDPYPSEKHIKYQDNEMSQQQQSKSISQQNSVTQHPIRFDRNQKIEACNIF